MHPWPVRAAKKPDAWSRLVRIGRLGHSLRARAHRRRTPPDRRKRSRRRAARRRTNAQSGEGPLLRSPKRIPRPTLRPPMPATANAAPKMARSQSPRVRRHQGPVRPQPRIVGHRADQPQPVDRTSSSSGPPKESSDANTLRTIASARPARTLRDVTPTSALRTTRKTAASAPAPIVARGAAQNKPKCRHHKRDPLDRSNGHDGHQSEEIKPKSEGKKRPSGR